MDVGNSGCRRSIQCGRSPDAYTGAIISRQVAGTDEFDNQANAFIILNGTPGVARGALCVDVDIGQRQCFGRVVITCCTTLDVVVHDVVTVVAGDHGASHIETITGGGLCR